MLSALTGHRAPSRLSSGGSAGAAVYGPLTDEGVHLEALPGDAPFVLGRVSAVHPLFPLRPADGRRMFTGAALGTAAGEVRLRAFAELVEHVSAFLSGVEAGPRLVGSRRSASDEARLPAISPTLFACSAAGGGADVDVVSDDSSITWVEADRLDIGERVLVPALVAHLSWPVPPGEPRFARPGATGLAAHTDLDQAIRHGLLEVLERDACMLSWLVPGWPVRRLDPEMAGGALRRLCSVYACELSMYSVGEPGLPTVVLALLHKRDGSELTCGSACGPLGEGLITRAVSEAVMLQWTMRSAPRWRDDRPPSAPSRTSLDHVARAYALGAEVLGWYERQAARWRAGGEWAQPAGPPSSLPRAIGEHLGSAVIAVDVRDALARRAGWSVVRVLVPGAQPRLSGFCERSAFSARLGASLRRWSSRSDRFDLRPHPFG